MLNRKITVMAPNETYGATAVDIDGAGRLIVEQDTGELQILSAGEISVNV